MFRRLTTALLFAALLVAPLAVRAEIDKTPIMKTATGSAQRVTTDTTIYTHKITFHSKVGNAATVYVGGSTVSSSIFLASLSAGGAYTIVPSEFMDRQGEQFQLSDFYVLGTASDIISISYEVQAE